MYDHLHYIRQQLAQRGIPLVFEQFYFLPYKKGKLVYELYAYNRQLWVEVVRLPMGARIIADNNALEVTEQTMWQQAWEEFSGQVIIELKEAESYGGIEFIQLMLKQP